MAQGSAVSGFSARQQAALDAYGKEDFHSFFKYVWSLPHVIQLAEDQPELRLLPALSHRLHQLFKDVVVHVVWKNHGDCRKIWFPPVEGVHGQGLLKEFKVKAEKFEMEDKFMFTYDDSSCIAILDQATALSTFYTSDGIYSMAGKEFCIALDVALAMSGSEAVVESYYSVMKTQKMEGGQLNDTLVERTNVDWCFPMPVQCEETVKDVASLYLDGDKDAGLPRHRMPVFIDARGRALNKYAHGSKVLDRLAARTDFFVLNEKDRRLKR